METHTFIADNANEAVDRIRSELGPSAVVLSVRKLPRNGFSRLLNKEQIEVVARVETETPAREGPNPVIALQKEIQMLKEQFAAMRQWRLDPKLNTSRAEEGRSGHRISTSAQTESPLAEPDVSSYLSGLGLLPAFAREILDEAPKALRGNGAAHLDCLKNILRARWRGEPEQSEAAVHIFVGAPGSGKSTVLCKMLAQITLVEQQPAAVYQLDTHVANSCGQTAIFAEVVGARFERVAPQSFERREESVFVDIPGVSIGDEKGLRSVRTVIEYFGVPQVHLVLNGAYEAGHLLEQVRFFANLGITDLVVTHLDEEKRWGKAWNLILGTNYSIRYLSCGQNIPGDLIRPTPDSLISGKRGAE